MPFNNLIINGDFETSSISPWTGVGATINSAFSHSGSLSAQLSKKTGTAFVSQIIPVTPGRIFEFLASLAKTVSLPSPQVGVVIPYFDASLNLLGIGLNIVVLTDSLPVAGTEDWLEINGTTHEAPAGATQAFVIISKMAQSGTADIVVDDVALLELDGDSATEPIGPTDPAELVS